MQAYSVKSLRLRRNLCTILQLALLKYLRKKEETKKEEKEIISTSFLYETKTWDEKKQILYNNCILRKFVYVLHLFSVIDDKRNVYWRDLVESPELKAANQMYTKTDSTKTEL